MTETVLRGGERVVKGGAFDDDGNEKQPWVSFDENGSAFAIELGAAQQGKVLVTFADDGSANVVEPDDAFKGSLFGANPCMWLQSRY